MSRISAALRPHGLLLNLLPVATHPTDRTAEVRVGGTIRRLGYLGDTPRDIEDFQVAPAAQQAAIDAQQVVRERETRYPFVKPFDTVESWLTFMAAHEPAVMIPTDLVAHARALPPGTVGDVRITRVHYAARLRRT